MDQALILHLVSVLPSGTILRLRRTKLLGPADLECCQVIMWDVPPMFLTAEFHQRLPASESLWRCITAAEWEAKSGGEAGEGGKGRGLVLLANLCFLAS